MKQKIFILFMIGMSALVTGCPPKPGGTPLWMLFLGGGNSASVSGLTIGGTVLGLGAGDTVTLQLNGGESLVVNSNTGFKFATTLSTGANFKVLVTGATGTNCAASSNMGTMASSSVNNVAVVCSDTTYTVSVNVSGLEAGNTVVFQNNGTDDKSVSANGVAAFTTPVPQAAGYNVLVLTQPATLSQTCTPSGNTGTISGANVTVNVACGPAYYTVSGNYSGLAGNGLQVRLNNTLETITLNKAGGASGSFGFTGKVANGTSYVVSVPTQPTSLEQTCVVTNGTGTISGANITNVQVTCTTNPFTISGTVTGLSSGDTVHLQLNGTDDKYPSYASPSFSWSKADGTVWSVSVVTHAPGKTCSVTSGSGTLAGANVTNVAVDCVFNQYTVGGSVSGLCAGQSITLRNNGGNNTVVSGASPSFTFPAQNDLSSYNVTVYSTPTGVSCSVTNGSSSVAGANVTNVQVNCGGCNSCNGSGALTVTWQASRSYDVNNASGGGHRIYYQTTTGVSKSTVNVVDVPNTESTTTKSIPGLKQGCTYYVKVGGYSALNPTGGNLSSELSRTIP